MLKVALTGNIASGKTQVEKLFMAFGIPVVDADKIVAKLYSDDDFLQKMSKQFSNYNFIVNGKINREILANIVFQDNEFKNKLEKFVHPFVLKEIDDFYIKNAQKSCVVASIPLLFECGWQKYFDKIVLVFADDNLRQERLIARNNLSNEQAKKRMNVQMSQQEKISKSHFVIENNSSFENLEQNVKKVVEKLNAQ